MVLLGTILTEMIPLTILSRHSPLLCSTEILTRILTSMSYKVVPPQYSSNPIQPSFLVEVRFGTYRLCRHKNLAHFFSASHNNILSCRTQVKDLKRPSFLKLSKKSQLYPSRYTNCFTQDTFLCRLLKRTLKNPLGIFYSAGQIYEQLVLYPVMLQLK